MNPTDPQARRRELRAHITFLQTQLQIAPDAETRDELVRAQAELWALDEMMRGKMPWHE